MVVDDGSTDDVDAILSASPIPIRLIRMGARQGSAAARNTGARAAFGGVLVFLDADTCVHPDTLPAIASAFRSDPALGGLIGAYDDQPWKSNFYSQYRNLLHCYVHRTSSRQACTFWTGCGAIRRDLFLQYGGFNESPHHVDDIEFGSRLVRDGIRIELRPEIQVGHQKEWTFFSTLKTDVLLRGIPWAMLILRERHMPNTLNVSYRNRASVALVMLAVAAAITGFAKPDAWEFGIACLFGVAWANRSFYRFLGNRRGRGFVAGAFLAHLLHLLVCGLSFAAGWALFSFSEGLSPEPRPNTAEASAE